MSTYQVFETLILSAFVFKAMRMILATKTVSSWDRAKTKTCRYKDGSTNDWHP